jgi:hypothetical protein
MMMVKKTQILVLGFIVNIRKQSVVGNDMILQQSLEILLTKPAEEKAIDFGTQFDEGLVRRCKQSASRFGRIRAKKVDQACLHQSQIQSAQQRRHNIDGVDRGEWRKKDLVKSMDDPICGKLRPSAPEYQKEIRIFSYNVRCEDAGMEVQRQTMESNHSTDPLWVRAVILLFQKRWHCLSGEECASGVHLRRDMVFKPFQDNFPGGSGVVLELFERCINGDEDGVVGFGAVQIIHDLIELIDDFAEDARMFTVGDGIVDGVVELFLMRIA